MVYTLHSKPRTGNRVEPSAHRFWAEGSDKRLSTQYLRPNIQPIYQLVPGYDCSRGTHDGGDVYGSNRHSTLVLGIAHVVGVAWRSRCALHDLIL
jgi:hypothetical protein